MIADYWKKLITETGEGWTRFWFTPSNPYALCVLRICVGLIALYLHATYSFDLERLFGPEGLISKEAAVQLPQLPHDVRSDPSGISLSAVSYLFWLETPSELYIAHAIGGVILLLFTVGCFTRVTTVLSLIVSMAYLHRGWMVAAQSDYLVVILMFYLCFAPVGAALSFDAWRRKRTETAAEAKTRGSSWAANLVSRLIQVHLAWMLLMMAISQLGINAWWEGTATWWIMARPEARLLDLTFISRLGSNLPIHAWTYAIVLFELAFAALVWNRLLRPLILALSLVFWLSLAVITGLVPWCLLMLAAGVVFVSPEMLKSCCGGCCQKGTEGQPVPLENS